MASGVHYFFTNALPGTDRFRGSIVRLNDLTAHTWSAIHARNKMVLTGRLITVQFWNLDFKAATL